MSILLLWWLSGFLGITFIAFLYKDAKVPNEITIGGVISICVESCLGPVVWCVIFMGFLCGEERPKWESKVIFKRRE